MSTEGISHDSSGIVVPLGQRIGEIMEERGASYSLRAFGSRIGMSKDTLGRIVSGERVSTPSETERIADGLKMTIERLKQEDIKDDLLELEALLHSRKNRKRAMTLARGVAAVSMGMTERCHALNLLGKHNSCWPNMIIRTKLGWRH